MNAVNLIPADSRKRRMAPSASWPTLALIAGLLAVLAGTVLYVSAANNVKSRQAELAHVTASVASWRRVAGSYQSFTQTAQQRTQELADIRQLAAGRYPWEQLLSQIGGLMPAHAALSTLQATTSGSSAGSGTSPSSASGSTGTPARASTAAAPLPAVQLSGCAASQSTVAQTMVQLHRVEGVSAVTLASATDSSAGGSTSSPASTGSSGAGGCPFPVQFQMSLTFAAPAPAAATSATGSTAGTSTASTPASTASGSTAAASASSNSTGVQTQ